MLRTSDSFVIHELAKAVRSRGHTLREIHFDTRKEAGQEWVLYDYRKFLDEVFTFKPQLVLSLNHRGLNDHGGKISRLLSLLKIPMFSWHLDSPFWNLEPILLTDSPYLTVFCFDRSYTEPLAHLLKEADVAYLPNATDPDLFKPLPKKHRDRFDLTFVGSLCLKTFRKLAGKTLGVPRDRFTEVESFLDENLEASFSLPELATKARDRFPDAPQDPDQDAVCRLADEYEAYRYRARAITQLRDLSLRVYGFDDWLEIVDPEQFGGWAEYYSDLPGIYGSSRINLNLSRPQVRAGLNQRFFDVPAAEGFLLTDFREGLLEVFPEEGEIAVFRGEEDLKRQVEWFLSHPEHRTRMAKRARERVLEGHTYAHRIDEMERHFKTLGPLLKGRDFSYLLRFWREDRGFAESCRMLGQFLFHAGDFRGGRFLYEQLDRMGKADGEVWLRLGAIASSEGDVETSEAYLCRCFDTDPDSAVAHSVAGVNAEKLGHSAEALAHFRRSIDLGNADPNVPNRAAALREKLQPPIAVDPSRPGIAFALDQANLPFGGVRVILEYVDRLAERGYRVFLLTRRPQYSDWFPLRVPVVPKEHWEQTLNDVEAVVFSQHELYNHIPARHGLKRIFLAQHFFSDAGDQTRAHRTFSDLSVTLVSVSRHVRDAVESEMNRSSLLIHSGVNRDLFHPRPELKRVASGPKILFCYSANPLKGAEHGMEVMKRIKEDQPNVQLRMFGFGLRPKAEFDFEYFRLPEQEALARLYADSDVFLSTSRSEGFGLPCLEAMASGCAVVSTRNGGNADFCVHGENALLCDYGDTDEMARLAAGLLYDADLQARLTERGLETALRFSWDRSVDRMEEVCTSAHPSDG